MVSDAVWSMCQSNMRCCDLHEGETSSRVQLRLRIPHVRAEARPGDRWGGEGGRACQARAFHAVCWLGSWPSESARDKCVWNPGRKANAWISLGGFVGDRMLCPQLQSQFHPEAQSHGQCPSLPASLCQVRRANSPRWSSYASALRGLTGKSERPRAAGKPNQNACDGTPARLWELSRYPKSVHHLCF